MFTITLLNNHMQHIDITSLSIKYFIVMLINFIIKHRKYRCYAAYIQRPLGKHKLISLVYKENAVHKLNHYENHPQTSSFLEI